MRRLSVTPKAKLSSKEKRRIRLEDCVAEGRKAALALKTEAACPYGMHDEKVRAERTAWLYGYSQVKQ